MTIPDNRRPRCPMSSNGANSIANRLHHAGVIRSGPCFFRRPLLRLRAPSIFPLPFSPPPPLPPPSPPSKDEGSICSVRNDAEPAWRVRAQGDVRIVCCAHVHVHEENSRKHIPSQPKAKGEKKHCVLFHHSFPVAAISFIWKLTKLNFFSLGTMSKRQRVFSLETQGLFGGRLWCSPWKLASSMNNSGSLGGTISGRRSGYTHVK